MYLQFKHILDDTWKQMQEAAEQMAVASSAGGLFQALNSGLVEMELYETDDTSKAVADFFESIGRSVISNETYPLLDDATGRHLRDFEECRWMSEDEVARQTFASNCRDRLLDYFRHQRRKQQPEDCT